MAVTAMVHRIIWKMVVEFVPTEEIVVHVTPWALEVVQIVQQLESLLILLQLESQLATALKVLRQRMQTYLHTTVYSQLLNTNRGTKTMSQTTVELITDGKIQTADLASDLQKAFVPLGGIIMWYGSVASVPDGFSLCDGSTVNGYATPNLQDRFVIGAGNSYAVNATGGSANATLVSHTHTATAAGDQGEH